MPGFNSTGPEGKGSRTGRGLGKCNPNNKYITLSTATCILQIKLKQPIKLTSMAVKRM